MKRFFWYSLVVEMYRDVLGQSPRLASSSGPRTFEKLPRGPWLGDSFHLSLVQGYRRENHGDRRPDDGFKSGSIVFFFFFFMANTSQVWTLTTAQLTKIWNYDYHNCITQGWKIVVSNVICWHRLRCTIVEKTLDAEKYCCKENR